MTELFGFHFAVGILFSVILLVLGHYFPLPKRDLHPLIKYAFGVGIMLIGMFIWLGLGLGMWEIYKALWAFAIVSGITVSLCYGYDAMMGIETRDHIIESVLEPTEDGD